MKRIIGSWLLYGICFKINIYVLLGSQKAEYYHFAATAVFILFWTVFLYVSRTHKGFLEYSLCLAVVTFATSVLTMCVDLLPDGLGYNMIIPVLVVFPPLYGLRFLFSQQVTLLIAYMILSIIWMLGSVLMLWGLKKRTCE